MTDTKAALENKTSDVMFCNCCQVKLLDRDEQIGHYKCDWHRYNIHCRLKNLPPLSEDEFEKIAGEVSSISGSESDNSDDDDASDVNLTESEIGDNEHLAVYNHPKLFFRNKEGELMSVYRCLIYQKKFPIEDNKEVEKLISQLPERSKWVILLVSSGHFAGAIFKGKDVLDHKTFHRYTIRAKRGSAQSSRDNHGSAPKSAGASIRRHHEAALVQEVQELLTCWSEYIKASDLIFIRVPVANQSILFGGKNPAFKKDDQRIRNIPLTTRRPTFNEIKRVYQILSSVECYGEDFIPCMPQNLEKMNQLKKNSQYSSVYKGISDVSLLDDENKERIKLDDVSLNVIEEKCVPHLKHSVTVSKKVKKNFSVPEKELDTVSNEVKLDDAMIQLRNQIYTVCKCGDVAALKNLCLNFNTPRTVKICTNLENVVETPLVETTKSDSAGDLQEIPDTNSDKPISAINKNDMCSNDVAEFLNMPVSENGTTFLHLAAKEGHDEIITTLLEAGADPSVRDKSSKTPYILGDNKVRNAFRRFMASFPDRYDYVKAQVPGALTADMEIEKKKKAAEKRKAKKKSLNEKQKEKKAEEVQLLQEKRERERYLALSDREKRALAAEKRFLQQNAYQGATLPVLSRCWQCGIDITGKVPFEYADFKFCSTKCLREHRNKPAL
ncbi:Ankyrin repeat and zinc finger domain-containing protein 1 [Bulinus truncatus]|nr:Ankyrin repeat and zinc finger domain-containing protein 1 [Bulinus truncatus]